MTVLLATSGDLPQGEPGAGALDAVLRDRGIDFAWASWDDPSVDWSAADLVAVRSTWDYVTRHAEFLAWTASLDQARLLNGADVFAWNHDKRYLTELGDLPVVPTLLADDRDELADGVRHFGTAVVKPRVGAGGAGLLVVTDPDDPRLGRPVRSHPDYPEVDGPWVVQPLVESIRTHGESSVYVLDGRLGQRFDKLPGEGDVRVNEEFGGQVRAVATGDVGDLVMTAYDAMAGRFDRPLDYLRVDLLRWDGDWVVSELELIEPGLYLDVSPANAEPFADLVAARLAARA
ncbi:ATP-grasp domain-containing protein [Nocardioides sp. T5]|uniref:ATP-grasp domain-containing protein n=1 Tax=Nocardioides sp. T5 TaxID=3400182 RepID=UPI003A85FC37